MLLIPFQFHNADSESIDPILATALGDEMVSPHGWSWSWCRTGAGDCDSDCTLPWRVSGCLFAIRPSIRSIVPNSWEWNKRTERDHHHIKIHGFPFPIHPSQSNVKNNEKDEDYLASSFSFPFPFRCVEIISVLYFAKWCCVVVKTFRTQFQ